MNNTATIPSHTQHYFSSMNLSFWIRLWRFILVNPLPFARSIILFNAFFITSNDFICRERILVAICRERILVAICRERILVAIDQQSALFFSLRACGTQTTSLLTFFIFSKWRHMVDCDVFNLSANSRVLCRALHSTNDFKVSASKSDERSDLGSSFNDVSPE